MARILRNNQTIGFRLVTKNGKVVLMPEINKNYKKEGFTQISKISWEYMNTLVKPSITQWIVADYIYDLVNKTK